MGNAKRSRKPSEPENSCGFDSHTFLQNFRTRSSAEQEHDSAEVEAARSNRAGFTTLHAEVAQLGRRR